MDAVLLISDKAVALSQALVIALLDSVQVSNPLRASLHTGPLGRFFFARLRVIT